MPINSRWPAPKPSEVERARSFLKTQADRIRNQSRDGRPEVRQPNGIDPAEAAAWVDIALALLNCNEFLYVP